MNNQTRSKTLEDTPTVTSFSKADKDIIRM